MKSPEFSVNSPENPTKNGMFDRGRSPVAAGNLGSATAHPAGGAAGGATRSG